MHIEQLAAKTESCPKFVLVSRIGVWGGGIVLGAILLGVIRFDLGMMGAAVAALLGGIVVWRSNDSTAKEAAKELAQAEAGSGRVDRNHQLESITARARCIGEGRPRKFLSRSQCRMNLIGLAQVLQLPCSTYDSQQNRAFAHLI